MNLEFKKCFRFFAFPSRFSKIFLGIIGLQVILSKPVLADSEFAWVSCRESDGVVFNLLKDPESTSLLTSAQIEIFLNKTSVLDREVNIAEDYENAEVAVSNMNSQGYQSYVRLWYGPDSRELADTGEREDVVDLSTEEPAIEKPSLRETRKRGRAQKSESQPVVRVGLKKLKKMSPAIHSGLFRLEDKEIQQIIVERPRFGATARLTQSKRSFFLSMQNTRFLTERSDILVPENTDIVLVHFDSVKPNTGAPRVQSSETDEARDIPAVDCIIAVFTRDFPFEDNPYRPDWGLLFPAGKRGEKSAVEPESMKRGPF